MIFSPLRLKPLVWHLSLYLGSITACQAGIPLWTLVPLTPTQLALSPASSVQVQYQLTNQARRVHRLVVLPLPGVSQVTTAGNCPSPAVLAPQQSCVLTLAIKEQALTTPIKGGPLVCQDANRLQCYQPSAGDQLAITTLEQTPLGLAPMTLMTATLNDFYSQALTATGGIAPYQFVLVAGNLPVNLTLSASGMISGTPTASTNESFTIMVTDAAGQTTTQSYTLVVSNGKSCLLFVTSSLDTTNPYNEAITLNYTVVGGGGGAGGSSIGNYAAGGGGGSSALLVSGKLIIVASGGKGGNTGASLNRGTNGLQPPQSTVLLPATATIGVFVGGGGGGGGFINGGGGGSGYFGGGGGASSGGGSSSGGGGGSTTPGVGGSGDSADGSDGDRLQGGNGGSNAKGLGGQGGKETQGGGSDSNGVNGGGGGGGGGFGSGGGGGGGNGGIGGQGGSTDIGSQNGTSGTSNSVVYFGGSGGLGATNWTDTLPPAAGAGGLTTAAGGNSGLVILQYQSPTDSCLLGQ